ncbi:hypothetical protein EAX62_03020 [Tessaracoccus antarcticus]|uniref:Uncharacterized protein n=1 Tax=Tessaracoccus antarcticus TaxID=2479848 RepID=A0A3M0GKE6_9ACTN|nr:hypothetical protein EAX62_03020 [Tessaracoccus antarcticus]
MLAMPCTGEEDAPVRLIHRPAHGHDAPGSQLLACTEAGYWAVRRILVAQHPWADRIGDAVGGDDLRAALVVMQHLIEALEVHHS